MEMFPELFKGIRKLPGEYSIELKKDAKPVHLPARNVPEALHEPLKRQQNRMVKMGVITPVHEATDWCHNLVYVNKADKSLRICLDPQNLNKWIQVPKYYIPSNLIFS